MRFTVNLGTTMSMMILIAGLVMLVLVPAAYADEISIGEVTLTLVPPQGFARASSQMESLFEVEAQVKLLAAFVPDTPSSLPDESVFPERYFTAQIDRNLIPVPMPNADFRGLKDLVRSQNDEFASEVRELVPPEIKELLDGEAGSASDEELTAAFSALSIVPLIAHENSDRTLAYSYIVNGEASGRLTPRASAVTVSLVHARGKVLLLYAHAPATELKWTRSASHEWVKVIVDANTAEAPDSATDDPASTSRDDLFQIRPLAPAERSKMFLSVHVGGVGVDPSAVMRSYFSTARLVPGAAKGWRRNDHYMWATRKPQQKNRKRRFSAGSLVLLCASRLVKAQVPNRRLQRLASESSLHNCRPAGAGARAAAP